MSGYRFCRTDDVPLLVEAYNRCYAVHFDGAPAMTVSDFKKDTRELDLWASSCMIAFSGDELVGVLLGGKRDAETLVHSIGVHPEHHRRGHGQHLLQSLRRKLGILGPPRLVAEIPAEWPQACRFFEACEFAAEDRFADFVRSKPSAAADASDLAVPVTLDEVVESGAWGDVPRSWSRSLVSLTKRKEALAGLAVVSDVRIEAWLLHEPRQGGGREIAALGCAGGPEGETLLGILVQRASPPEVNPVSISRVSEREVPFARLSSWGFRCTREYLGYAALAARS